MNFTDSADPPRALIIVVRGLSPFFLSPYGNEWVHGPTFDRLESRGITFDQHFASDLENDNIAERLIKIASDRKITCMRIRDTAKSDRPRHALLEIRRQLYEQLDKLSETQPAIAIVETDAVMPPWDPPSRYLNFYFGKVQTQQGEDSPPSPWHDALPDHVAKDDDLTLERLQDTFAAVMSLFDRGLTKLLTGARRRGFGQNALIAITSDRAFPVGEQGPVGWHELGIRECTTHIPLILRLPQNDHADYRIPGLTQPDDFTAAIAEYLDGKADGGLWALIGGKQETLHDHVVIRYGADVAVHTNDLLCVVPTTGNPSLFIKPDDRWEMCDVASHRQEELDRLVQLAQAAKQ